MRSALYQPDVARARTFLRFLRRELDSLPFAQQLEHGAADGAAVEEVLDPSLDPDEPEPLGNQEPCDSPGWHTRSPPFRSPQGHPKGTQAGWARAHERRSHRT